MKKYLVNTWRRPNRKMKRLLEKLLAENGNAYTYINRVNYYNDRVGQAHQGISNFRKEIRRRTKVQGTTSMGMPRRLFERNTYNR